MPRVMRTPRTDLQARHRPVSKLLAFTILALAVAGCSSMTSIDRHIDRLVQNQSRELGGGAVAPDVRSRPIESDRPSGAYTKSPGTENPSADELEFQGAPADRDVLSRLEGYSQFPPDTLEMNLEEVFRVAQRSGREFLNAEEDYLLAAIRLLIERHLWGPRFFNDLSVQFDGARNFAGTFQSAMTVINDLRVTQRLPYGGDVEARLVTQAVRQLSGAVGDATTQSTQLILSTDIPLLRDAGRIAREDLIQASRDLIYAARDFEAFRRSFLVDIARDYFNLIAQQSAIQNQVDRLDSVIEFQRRTEALVTAGREAPFAASNVKQNVLTSRNSLINSREGYILSLDRFKVRLGIPIETPLRLLPISINLEDPDITVSEAAQIALRYRLDLQNETDRLDDAKRGVANSRNQLLPNLDLNASTTIGTDDNRRLGGLDLDFDDTAYSAGITFGLPLDREIERLQLRSSLINLARQNRNLEQFRDNVILDARAAVREIDRSRFSIGLQEQAVGINERRVEELEININEATPQELLDAENELLQARNDRDRAIRDLRTAILDFLRLTGQMRVTADGRLDPLSGMIFEILDEEAEIEPAGNSPAPNQGDPNTPDPETPEGG